MGIRVKHFVGLRDISGTILFSVCDFCNGDCKHKKLCISEMNCESVCVGVHTSIHYWCVSVIVLQLGVVQHFGSS